MLLVVLVYVWIYKQVNTYIGRLYVNFLKIKLVEQTINDL